ncbi:MAG TPA: hypothetical protein VFK93_00695 [Candidatus Limnocylindria bacterium]|nr:hypothetical protein [Candidatus Limnocylindria bacterium]
MSSARRPGFRLPWAGGEQQDEAAAAASPTAEAGPQAADAPDAKPKPEQSEAAPEPEPVDKGAAVPDAPEATAEGASTPPAGAVARDEAGPNPFLRNLVEAMRKVAEETRTAGLAELKTKVEERIEQLRAGGADQVEDLRRQSETDVTAVGDWERGEIERIRAEAGRRVEARKQLLEEQLAERERRTEAEITATRTRLADYERELASFLADLSEIDDPATFVAAAKRMPQPPTLDLPRPAAAANADAASSSLSARLAMLGVEHTGASEAAPSASNGSTAPTTSSTPAAVSGAATAVAGTAPAPATPKADEAAPSSAPEPPASAAAGDAADVTSAIMVSGLGSFGAITSFKQSLEKSVGIRSVSLSLGPTGEFVYRAAHRPDFDIEAAIRSIETGTSSIERQSDGTLRVTVVRAR